MKASNCVVTIITSNHNKGFELPVVARTPGYTWYQTEVQTSNPYQVVRAIEGTQVFSEDCYPDEEMIVTVTHPPYRHEYGGAHHCTRKGLEAVLNKKYC